MMRYRPNFRERKTRRPAPLSRLGPVGVAEPERPDDDGPDDLHCEFCENPRHDGLESLSPYVRQGMIDSLTLDGDPLGLLAKYREFVAQHPAEMQVGPHD